MAKMLIMVLVGVEVTIQEFIQVAVRAVTVVLALLAAVAQLALTVAEVEAGRVTRMRRALAEMEIPALRVVKAAGVVAWLVAGLEAEVLVVAELVFLVKEAMARLAAGEVQAEQAVAVNLEEVMARVLVGQRTSLAAGQRPDLLERFVLFGPVIPAHSHQPAWGRHEFVY